MTIHCNDIAELALICATLCRQGITFVASTITLQIELKGY